MAYVNPAGSTLWRSKLDGSERLKLGLPAGALEGRQPHWSPDGKQIAFMARFPDDRLKAYLVSADGGEPRPLVPDHSGEEGVPTWSNDGKQLVFGEPANRREASTMTIHAFDLQTDQLSTLPDSSGLWTARWSPDGHYIAALAVSKESLGSSTALRLFDRTMQRWTTVVENNYIDEPAWSPDSRYIYFDTFGPDAGVYRIGITERKPVLVVSLREIPRERWVGVTPNGSPLITRHNIFQEIYALDVDLP